MQLDIAIGKSRKDLNWQNKKMTWEELVVRLQEVTRTHLTYEEYINSPKATQDEIKDVGGFIGGYVKGGKRVAANITHRQVISLDIDHASSVDGIWSLNKKAVLYSTHKHTSSKPRLRLIIPLDRPVNPDEYEAIARMIASKININIFDDTTYQANRLMYWPACAKDGDYYFKEFKGEYIAADAILKLYVDWSDRSSWPRSERDTKVLEKNLGKQQDPLEKNNIIGAFCRIYDIHRAIETFLADVYVRSSEDRYSYSAGSTAKGVVIYDDKFSYSHHETDPAGGKLCNAWDLVRLHKFASLDEETDSKTRIDRLPSFAAMSEFVLEDDEVKTELIKMRREEALHDFDEVEYSPLDWEGELDVDKKGNIFPSRKNIILILENDPKLKNLIAFNEFIEDEAKKIEPPWGFTGFEEAWSDRDSAELRVYLENTYRVEHKGNIEDALIHVANKNKFHPVREYLSTLNWDGVERLETLFIDYLGAPDLPYIRSATKKAFTGAVSRVMEPGCKMDYAIVLQGGQGIGKSTIIRKMAVKDNWYNSTIPINDPKAAEESLYGVWIIEFEELAGFKRSETETIKSFITKQSSKQRRAYAKRNKLYLRQNIFIGSTNETEILKDSTGERRYWVIPCDGKKIKKNVHKQLTRKDVDQLWAEALIYYYTGEELLLSPEDTEAMEESYADYKMSDPWEDAIADYIETPIPLDWYDLDHYQRMEWLEARDNGDKETMMRNRVTAKEIMEECLQKNISSAQQFDKNRIYKLLDSMKGWEKMEGRQKILRERSGNTYTTYSRKDSK